MKETGGSHGMGSLDPYWIVIHHTRAHGQWTSMLNPIYRFTECFVLCVFTVPLGPNVWFWLKVILLRLTTHTYYLLPQFVTYWRYFVQSSHKSNRFFRSNNTGSNAIMRFSLSAVFVSEISEIGFNEVENQPTTTWGNSEVKKLHGEFFWNS